MVDAVVIGGGPAGLQAALTMGRVHRSVVLVDSGRYRNATVEHLHNLISHDGQDPAELRAAARRDVARYDTVTTVDDEVLEISGTAGDFTVTLAQGTPLAARAVILATGLRDELPDVPGLSELWGRQVAHCPFCHGHELAGKTSAVLGSVAAQLTHLTGFLTPIAGEHLVLTHGAQIDADAEASLRSMGAQIHTATVERLVTEASGRVRVELADGSSVLIDGLFVAPTSQQAAPFAAQLGLEQSASGGIVLDAFARTSVTGVYAAGDAAHHRELPMAMASVASAIGAGVLAGSACTADLMAVRA